MSTTLPHRISEAPVGPDASSFDGSTLSARESPVAAEYIPAAASSSATAVTANEIASRVEMGRLPRSIFNSG